MITKIKSLFFNDKYKVMINNFSYLSIITIADKVLPLIIVPYIVRTIGVEKFGIIAFALMIAMYFKMITQYSFELTATKYISLNRDDIKKISHHFYLVLAVKFILSLISFIFFIVLLLSVERLYLEKEVFLFTFLLVFGDVLIPLWFFRGMEEMKYIAIFSIVAKLMYAALVFIFVHVENDYVLIPLFNSLTLFIVSAYALYFARKKFKVYFIKPKFKSIIDELREGKDIFYSNMSVSFYTTINTLLLGVFTNYTTVGVYALAEAIFNAYSSIIKIYTTVVYPYLARYSNDMKNLMIQTKMFFKLYVILLILASLFLYIISGFVIELLYGKGHDISIEILRLLSISLLLEPLGGFFTAYLSLKSQYKIISGITFKTMIFNLFMVVPMILIFNEKSIAYLAILLSLVQVSLNISKNREIFNIRSSV